VGAVVVVGLPASIVGAVVGLWAATCLAGRITTAVWRWGAAGHKWAGLAHPVMADESEWASSPGCTKRARCGHLACAAFG
jgi:hypothetical protein